MFRLAMFLVFTAAVSGCGGDLSGGPEAVSRITVTAGGKDIIIAGPKGFCIDPTATQETSKGAFVLLGDCRATTGSKRNKAPMNALLTASIAGNGFAKGETPDDMARFFHSELGRKTLSAQGNAKSVEAIETVLVNDVLYIQVKDTSDPIFPRVTQSSWRGIFQVNERLVSVSLFGFENTGYNPKKGFTQIKKFSEILQALNSPAKAGKGGSEDTETDSPRLKGLGLLRKLFQ